MRRTLRFEEFVASPKGRFVVGRTYLAWCARLDLGGTVIWGRPSERDATELAQLWDYDRALPGRFDVVSDLSRVSAIDAPPFDLLVRYVASRRDEYDQRVRRHALVRPAGLSGAAVAGFNALIDPRFEWRVVASAGEAFAWLDRADGPDLLAEVEALVEAHVGPGETRSGAREAGALGLQPRQRQVLDRLLAGDAEKEIADRLGLTSGTVHQYVKAVYRAYGVSSRAQLLVRCLGAER